ncbi:MAG: hypothetical protein Q4D91_13335 [Lautropia sp.]|nr:hypothetical protein [Lautropia sp.]
MSKGLTMDGSGNLRPCATQARESVGEIQVFERRVSKDLSRPCVEHERFQHGGSAFVEAWAIWRRKAEEVGLWDEAEDDPFKDLRDQGDRQIPDFD